MGHIVWVLPVRLMGPAEKWVPWYSRIPLHPPSYGTKLSNQYHFPFTRSLYEASLPIRASLPSLLAPASSRTEQGLYLWLYYVPHVVPGYAATKYLVNKHTISNTFCAPPSCTVPAFPLTWSLYTVTLSQFLIGSTPPLPLRIPPLVSVLPPLHSGRTEGLWALSRNTMSTVSAKRHRENWGSSQHGTPLGLGGWLRPLEEGDR